MSSFFSLTPSQELSLSILSTLVLFMQAGFALLEAGACARAMLPLLSSLPFFSSPPTRAGTAAKRHQMNIIMKNMLDMGISAICFWSVGWALAFGPGPNAFAGSSQFFLIDLPESSFVIWFFEYSFR